MNKKTLIAVTAVAAAAYVCFELNSRSIVLPQRHAEKSQKVGVARQTEISAPGIVEPARPELEVMPEVLGRIVKVPVALGDWVEKGALLVQIDPVDYRYKVAVAEADLQSAEADYLRLKNGPLAAELRAVDADVVATQARFEQAQKSLARSEQLSVTGTVSPESLEQRQLQVNVLRANVEAARAAADRLRMGARQEELAVAQARIKAAKATLDHANVQLDRTQIRAPFSGEVLTLEVVEGEVLSNMSTAPLMVIGDTRGLRVRAWIENLDAPKVGVGMKAYITADGFEGRVYVGEVSEISPRMSRKNLRSNRPSDQWVDSWTREVWIRVEESADLISGMRVDVRLTCEKHILADSRGAVAGPPRGVK